MQDQEKKTRTSHFKVTRGIYVGVLMSPTEVAKATQHRDGDMYKRLQRWTLCGEVSRTLMEVLQVTQMRLGSNERITAFAAPSGLNYAVVTHQVAMFQHRYLVPLFDGQVTQCMEEVGREGGLGYSLAGEGDQALVWPSVLGARDVMPLKVLCGRVAEGQEEEALAEYARVVSETQDPQRIPSLDQGSVVRYVSVSAIPPLDVVGRLTRRYGAAA